MKEEISENKLSDAVGAGTIKTLTYDETGNLTGFVDSEDEYHFSTTPQYDAQKKLLGYTDISYGPNQQPITTMYYFK
jgi:hypothetical protein